MKKRIKYLNNFIKDNIKLISPREAFELKKRKEFLIKNKLISFDYKKKAFINYARNFEYEEYIKDSQSTSNQKETKLK